jgi:hypothetical protein
MRMKWPRTVRSHLKLTIVLLEKARMDEDGVLRIVTDGFWLSPIEL